MYSQGLATMAPCQAYGMSKAYGMPDETAASAARLRRGLYPAGTEPSTGGCTTPGQSGDTSVFGWQIMAQDAADGRPAGRFAGLDNAQKRLRSVSKGEHRRFLLTYRPYREVTPTMTAVGFCFAAKSRGSIRKSPAVLEGKEQPDGELARPQDRSVNCYYWYYSTLAMHNFLDSDWDAWN